jgi:hypothetical protein
MLATSFIPSETFAPMIHEAGWPWKVALFAAFIVLFSLVGPLATMVVGARACFSAKRNTRNRIRSHGGGTYR